MKNPEHPTDAAASRNFYDMFPAAWSRVDWSNEQGQTPDTLPAAVESQERQGLATAQNLGMEAVEFSQAENS